MKKKLAFFFTALMLFYTGLTDADLIDVEVVPNNNLRATTLDFANKATANNMAQSTLFNVVGMVKGGFAVESLRIEKEGELNFNYQINAVTGINEAGLCDSMELIVEENFERKYEGSLSDFVLLGEVEEYDDLVFFLKLENPSDEQKAKNCSFNFVFKTVLEESGLSDEEVVINQVGAGVW